MSLGILTSKLQVVKTLKDHEYVQRIREYNYLEGIKNVTSKISPDFGDSDYGHVSTRKTRAQLIRLSAAICGIELCYSAETAFVSPILLKLGVPVAFMTLVWCASPLLGLVLVPIMGSLSDRCPLKLGRRRPFIILYAVGVLIGLVLVPNGEWFGILAGDSSSAPVNGSSAYNNVTQVQKINETNNLVTFENGTSVILRSEFTPEWPSTEQLPPKHVIGIVLTILGVALLDFNCDACQSPCRTYLLDISVPEDHSRGLTSFTVMAGLGGSLGYLMGGINWELTSFGAALGGHVRVVFTGVMILFIICVILTLTSFREVPLGDLALTQDQLQKNVKTIKKAKYRKFMNESSTEEDEEDEKESRNVPKESDVVKDAADNRISYGTLGHPGNQKTLVNGSSRQSKDVIGLNDSKNGTNQSDLKGEGVQTNSDRKLEVMTDATKQLATELDNFRDEVSLKTYLRSIVKMPRSMQILCLTNLFCWMSLVCYSLYFTDFVGQSVFGGDPLAPLGSDKHDLYDDGVRLGSFGMSLYSLACALYSMCVEYLVERFGARPVYVCGQLVYTTGMVVLAVTRQPATVILMSPCAGIMYATLFTMPYLIIAHYHTSGQFGQHEADEKGTKIRGLGTDVAVVSSMVFLAQFLLSLFMGSLVHLTGSTVTIVVAAAILSFCGAVCATQVTYLDL